MFGLTHITLSRLFLALLLVPLTGFTEPTSDTSTAMETSLLRFANKLYAITLTASSTAQSAVAMKKVYPDLIVYQTHVSVAGSRLNFLRLGFFASQDEAKAMLPKVRSLYPDAWVTQVTPLEQVTALGIDLETLAKTIVRPSPAGVPPSAPPAPAKPSAGYALHLDVATSPQFTPPSLPTALKSYHLYVQRLTGAQGMEFHLNLGVFADRESAEQARDKLLARYPQATLREITAGEKAQVATLPVQPAPGMTAKPAAPSVAAKTPTPGTDDTAQRARGLLDRAQDQIIAHQYDAAVKTLTEILALPKNIYTADAIEYTGLAYDRSGQIPLAILNYQAYLVVFPDGPGMYRVNQRLQALRTAPPPAPGAPAPTTVTGLYEPHVVGTLSQFYNRGASRSLVNVPTAGEAPLLTATTQASLATNLNMTSTYQTEHFDNRFVLGDFYTYSHTFDPPDNSYPAYDTTNYLSAAYYETRDKQAGYTARLGRLLGTSWGIFGRYDGAQFIYSLTPGWRVAVSAGSPKEYKVDANRKFYGASVDAGPVANHWFGNLYYLHQEVDGIVDRQAVGSELRYADTLHSAYVLFDYDTSYQELNVGVFQLNWRTGGAMTYTLLVDHRLLPTLQTTNAIFGNPNVSSFSVLENTANLAAIRKEALDRTVTANNYSAGFNWQVNSKWQLGGDARLYNTSTVPAIDTNPAIPGTGDIYVYTLQTRGSGLLSPRDITQISISHKTGAAVEGNTLSFTNTTLFGQALTFDTRLRLSKEHTRTSYTNAITRSETLLLSPSLRLSYRIKNSLSLEAEYGYERSVSSTDTYDTNTGIHTYSRPDLGLRYYTIGYRWNF